MPGEETASFLAGIVDMMRIAFGARSMGRHAILNSLFAALFTLVLRSAGESDQVPTGLLALAGVSRLAPAISAMFADPVHPWGIPELAWLCNIHLSF